MKAKNDRIKLQVRRDTDVRSFTLTYPVGSTSGWHEHPGIVVAVVRSGLVEQRVGCRRHTFGPDEAFTESSLHKVTNIGKVPAVLEITQFYPAGIAVPDLRLDRPAPRCS